MAKRTRKQSAKNKIKFGNKKAVDVARNFLFRDGRMTKEDIIGISNKTMFYKLKAGGYIEQVKNAEVGIFKTTGRFREQYKREVDASAKWKGSGSTGHANGFRILAGMVGEKAIAEGRFESSESCKDRVDSVKKTAEFRNKAEQMVQTKEKQLEEALASAKDPKTIALLEKQLSKLTEHNYKGFSAPDARVFLERQEAEQMVEKMREYSKECHHSVRDQWEQASQKLEQIIRVTTTKQIAVSIEVYTGNYKGMDKYSHEAYEEVTEEMTIYVPSK